MQYIKYINKKYILAYASLIEIIITLLLISVILLTIGFTSFNLVFTSFSSFSDADKNFASSRLATLKFDYEIKNAIRIIAADQYSISLIDQNNNLIIYIIDNINKQIIKNINNINYLFIDNLAANINNSTNIFEYYDYALNKFTQLPLDNINLSNLKLIKLKFSINKHNMNYNSGIVIQNETLNYFDNT